MLIGINKFAAFLVLLLGEAGLDVLLLQLPNEPSMTLIDEVPSLPGSYLIFHECCQVVIGRIWIFYEKFFHSFNFGWGK
jgi:hypothetical protein